MAMLGSVEIFTEDEDEGHSVDATSHPVEKGEPFTDHIKKKPSEFSISGLILSDDWESDKDKLISMMNNGEIVKYVGKMTAFSVVILDVRLKHNWEVSNGASLTISLRRVRITTTPWQKSPPKAKTDQKPPTSGGAKKPIPAKPNPPKEIYHVTKKNDTYWGLSGKYGSSISQLRSWNSYEDTKIPIGIKLRVK